MAFLLEHFEGVFSFLVLFSRLCGAKDPLLPDGNDVLTGWWSRLKLWIVPTVLTLVTRRGSWDWGNNHNSLTFTGPTTRQGTLGKKC